MHSAPPRRYLAQEREARKCEGLASEHRAGGKGLRSPQKGRSVALKNRFDQ